MEGFEKYETGRKWASFMGKYARIKDLKVRDQIAGYSKLGFGEFWEEGAFPNQCSLQGGQF